MCSLIDYVEYWELRFFIFEIEDVYKGAFVESGRVR